MRQLFFKYACVFIILIFCLAPLGAIDLDNNTKYINQNDNEKGVAQFDDNLSPVNQSGCNVSEKTIGNNTENLSAYPDDSDEEFEPIVISVEDIYEGEEAFIEVRTADFINDGVWICTYGNYNWVWMENGYACTTIKGLRPGTYTVNVYVQSSPAQNTTQFNVKSRISPVSSVEVKDILAGQRAVAEVHTDKSYTGEVDLALDNSTETKTIKIENGYGKATFDEDLWPGNHNVEASSPESREFKASTKSTTFKVEKQCALDVQVDDIYQGDPLVVKVNTTKNYNGSAYLTVDDDYSVKEYAKNGCFTHTLNSDNLTPGTHEVYVILEGNSFFDVWKSYKIIKFNVKEK